MGLSRAERAERARLNLLEAAALVFAENGYERTVLSDAVSASGRTRGAMYHHSASMDELVERVLQDTAGASDAISARRALLRVRAEAAGHSIHTRVAPARRGGPRRFAPGSVFEYQGLAFQAFAELVRRGPDGGDVRTDLDPGPLRS